MLLIKQYEEGTARYSMYPKGVAWAIEFKTNDEAIKTMLHLAYEEEEEVEILGTTLFCDGALVYEYGDNGANIGDYSYSLVEELDYHNLQLYGELLDATLEGTVLLYELDGQKYVVLPDNTVISQEEDCEIEGSSFPEWYD